MFSARAFKLFPQVYCNIEKPDFDDLSWLQGVAQEVVLVLLITFILARLLRLGTKRLVQLSHAQELISGRRALQLRTLAGVLNSMGIFVIVFMASMWILPAFCMDIKPLLASAGVVGLAIGFGAQTLVKLKAGMVTGIDQIGLPIALERGFFEKNGLDVTIARPYATGVDALNAFTKRRLAEIDGFAAELVAGVQRSLSRSAMLTAPCTWSLTVK